jgi:hypothetical protein
VRVFPVDLTRNQEKALRASHISSRDRKMIKQGLSTVRMKYERPIWTQDAAMARYLDPFIFYEFSQPSSSTPGLGRKVTIVCFPYFLLDEPSRQIELLSHSNHPPLTLLQTLSSSIALERDMQQVVCGSPLGQKTRCFHVSQLWGVVLDDRKSDIGPPYLCTLNHSKDFFTLVPIYQGESFSGML